MGRPKPVDRSNPEVLFGATTPLWNLNNDSEFALQNSVIVKVWTAALSKKEEFITSSGDVPFGDIHNLLHLVERGDSLDAAEKTEIHRLRSTPVKGGFRGIRIGAPMAGLFPTEEEQVIPGFGNMLQESSISVWDYYRATLYQNAPVQDVRSIPRPQFLVEDPNSDIMDVHGREFRDLGWPVHFGLQELDMSERLRLRNAPYKQGVETVHFGWLPTDGSEPETFATEQDYMARGSCLYRMHVGKLPMEEALDLDILSPAIGPTMNIPVMAPTAEVEPEAPDTHNWGTPDPLLPETGFDKGY